MQSALLQFIGEFIRTHAVTEELCPGTRSIIKVDAAFMRAVIANPAMRKYIQGF
jgi:hypothetical protein